MSLSLAKKQLESLSQSSKKDGKKKNKSNAPTMELRTPKALGNVNNSNG